jgi:thiol:disulfide interchange protein/DsbC/DsbD-like thiol-disulfide interchange protein
MTELNATKFTAASGKRGQASGLGLVFVWCLLLAGCLLPGVGFGAGAATDTAAEPYADPFLNNPSANVAASLISEVKGIEPGKPFWVLLRQQIRSGWHTYWLNPGDSGAPTRIDWDLPAGFSAGEIQWPYPERIAYGPLMNFGYSNDVYYPVMITPPADLSAGTVTLQARVGWLVCADICIPEKTILTLVLPTGTAATGVDPDQAPIFAEARQRVPVASGLAASWSQVGKQLVLTVPAMGSEEASGGGAQVKKVEYFPFTEGVMENAAPQLLNIDGAGLALTLAPGWDFAPDASLDGIIVVHEDVGDLLVSAFEVRPAGGAASVPMNAGDLPVGSGVWLAILFAFLGGLILNLMPCVFPVLSIKVLSLVQQVGADAHKVRLHGWVYLLGVVASFLLMAGLLIALRAGGAQIGWGFQLQAPWVIGLLVYLFFLIGLNLSGFFEIGAGVMGVGSSLLQRQGYGGSFFTGVLATLVAAPCTAPFMASAVGFALTQPSLVALAIFAALGLGMAAPYVLLCYSPRLLRMLPRPGPWMVRFKELLAFPMYASAIWLVWVLTQQAGASGMLVVLAGLLLLVFAIWLLRGLGGSLLRRRSLLGLALLVSGLAIYLPMSLSTIVVTADGAAAPGRAEANYVGPVHEPYSDARLAELLVQGPVFINLTAAWCITCKVNEAVALNREGMRAAFGDKNVAYLRGDWTNADPTISRLLESYGRSGVPLYLLYPGGAAAAEVLPQLLTEGIVRNALAALPVPAGS